MTSISFEDFCSELRKYNTFVVCAHTSPDSDAVGSSVGLARGLMSLGKEVVIYLPEGIPTRIAPFVKGVSVVEAIPKRSFDAVIVVDTATAERIAGESEAIRKCASVVFNLDHHSSNPAWGDLAFIRASAPSSTVLVKEVLDKLGAIVDADTANLLLAGLMDDTGCFRFSNATEESFKYAGEFVSLGAKPEIVANSLYFSIPDRVIRLRAKSSETLRRELSGKLAIMNCTLAMLKECLATEEDADGLVEITRGVEGTVAAVFIRETEKEWKLSLRSKNSSIDVNKIAGIFGGGGHIAAAGCRMKGTLAEVEEKIIKAFSDVITVA